MLPLLHAANITVNLQSTQYSIDNHMILCQFKHTLAWCLALAAVRSKSASATVGLDGSPLTTINLIPTLTCMSAHVCNSTAQQYTTAYSMHQCNCCIKSACALCDLTHRTRGAALLQCTYERVMNCIQYCCVACKLRASELYCML
jgi:hypothetical protein